MLKASEARNITVVDEEKVEWLVENISAGIEQASAKGERSVEAWFYDKFDRKYSGDLTAAVVEEVDRRFEDAGYELSWATDPMLGGVVFRKYSW